MRRAFFIGYGFLPFWVATTGVFIGGHFSHGDYWNAEPWLILFSIPVSVVTLLVALITLNIHARAPGDRSRKKVAATKAFLAMNLVLIAIVMWLIRLQRYDKIM